MVERILYCSGNTKFGSSIFSKITAAAEEVKQKFPFTLGLNQFDFINYEEFCKQVASCITQDKINGIINICSEDQRSWQIELRFISENNYQIKLEYGAFPDRPYDSKAVWGNNAKIQEILKK